MHCYLQLGAFWRDIPGTAYLWFGFHQHQGDHHLVYCVHSQIWCLLFLAGHWAVQLHQDRLHMQSTHILCVMSVRDKLQKMSVIIRMYPG